MFDEHGLIPVVTTDFTSGEVLMHAYMNAEALTQTITLGEAVYWSRSRKCLWHKGRDERPDAASPRDPSRRHSNQTCFELLPHALLIEVAAD